MDRLRNGVRGLMRLLGMAASLLASAALLRSALLAGSAINDGVVGSVISAGVIVYAIFSILFFVGAGWLLTEMGKP